MPELTNQDMIYIHLEQYAHTASRSVEGYVPHWSELMAYCLGYYGEVTQEMITVVMTLQHEGKVK